MLERLDSVPWAELTHAYGSAEDVPGLLRDLLNPDTAVRNKTLDKLYGNVFHQGTRYPVTPYVVPFLIELCESPDTPRRIHILSYWQSLIAGYFSVLERPIWGDGETIHWGDQSYPTNWNDPYSVALHQIYRESLKGLDLLLSLIHNPNPTVRAGSAEVLACLPTVADKSTPALIAKLASEPVGWVRAAYAFALGELRCSEPLRRIVLEDDCPAARCMAACELARIHPEPMLVELLIQFVAEPIEGYDAIPGTGGKSTGDAAVAIAYLPTDVKWQAAPVICERLKQTQSFDTMPLVRSLLSIAFEPRYEPVTKLTEAQRRVLICLINCQDAWLIANLFSDYEAHGLPTDRKKCAKIAGVRYVEDHVLAALSTGTLFSNMGFLDKAREHIEDALRQDPKIFTRTPAPEECWLLCAKAYAETDAPRAIEAYRQSIALNPTMAQRVDATWALFALIANQHGGTL